MKDFIDEVLKMFFEQKVSVFEDIQDEIIPGILIGTRPAAVSDIFYVDGGEVEYGEFFEITVTNEQGKKFISGLFDNFFELYQSYGTYRYIIWDVTEGNGGFWLKVTPDTLPIINYFEGW